MISALSQIYKLNFHQDKLKGSEWKEEYYAEWCEKSQTGFTTSSLTFLSSDS